MPTALESFLQQMISEKSDHSMGTASITIVSDNACPARHRKRSKKSKSCSLDVSDHSKGKSRWVAQSNECCDSISPVPAPKHNVSPRITLGKTLVVVESDLEDEDDDGLIL